MEGGDHCPGSRADEKAAYRFSGSRSFMYDVQFEHAPLLVGDESTLTMEWVQQT